MYVPLADQSVIQTEKHNSNTPFHFICTKTKNEKENEEKGMMPQGIRKDLARAISDKDEPASLTDAGVMVATKKMG